MHAVRKIVPIIICTLLGHAITLLTATLACPTLPEAVTVDELPGRNLAMFVLQMQQGLLSVTDFELWLQEAFSPLAEQHSEVVWSEIDACHQAPGTSHVYGLTL